MNFRPRAGNYSRHDLKCKSDPCSKCLTGKSQNTVQEKERQTISGSPAQRSIPQNAEKELISFGTHRYETLQGMTYQNLKQLHCENYLRQFCYSLSSRSTYQAHTNINTKKAHEK